ncbi:SPOR domain-containing protein [soil metagenome]
MADQYRDRPFPADDDYGRDSLRIAPQPQGSSDPLAELARLIGQADPFSTFAREQPARHVQPDPVRHDQYAEPDSYAPEPSYPPEPYEDESLPAGRPSWVQNLTAGRQTHEPSFHEEDPFDPRYAAAALDPVAVHRDPPFDHSAYDPLPQTQALDQQAAGDRYEDVLYGRTEHDQTSSRHYAQDGAYDDNYDRPPYDDGFDQEEHKPRRCGMMTVVVVLLLAVVGTGAAFAYRTFVGSPRSGEPPVIKADTGPNKVIPPGAGDGSGKQITDRVGDKSAERVVSREEQPVDVNAKTNPNVGPRVVFPPLTQNANPPTVASASTATRPTGTGVGNGTLGGEEPRKIRTLSIRPDQADASAAPAAPTPRAQAPAQRTAAPASTASTNGAPSANAPVSLSPQAAPAAAGPKVAAVNPSIGAGGGAYVQVSSQKSEADARASFKALQGKYAGILGSRTASIHKAEIAGKGTFYRAMVGPFSGEEAVQFCTSLKSAGGQCVIQRN